MQVACCVVRAARQGKSQPTTASGWSKRNTGCVFRKRDFAESENPGLLSTCRGLPDKWRAISELKRALASTKIRSSPLLSCTEPQGSKVEVLQRGFRTAFVRVFESMRVDAKATFQPETCGMNNRNAVEIADQSDWNV